MLIKPYPLAGGATLSMTRPARPVEWWHRRAYRGLVIRQVMAKTPSVNWETTRRTPGCYAPITISCLVSPGERTVGTEARTRSSRLAGRFEGQPVPDEDHVRLRHGLLHRCVRPLRDRHRGLPAQKPVAPGDEPGFIAELDHPRRLGGRCPGLRAGGRHPRAQADLRLRGTDPGHRGDCFRVRAELQIGRAHV